jgi:predicted DNA-binding protein (MmcQ/YjbR family)
MNLESLREYCLSLRGTTEDFPFGEETLVFRVQGKIYLLTPLDGETFRFNVKCDPERAQELRAEYDIVHPGYHMNKKHWNTIIPQGNTPDLQLRTWIKHSYELIVAGLPAKLRAELL